MKVYMCHKFSCVGICVNVVKPWMNATLQMLHSLVAMLQMLHSLVAMLQMLHSLVAMLQALQSLHSLF